MSGRMGRKLLHWEIAGFVVTGAAGPLLHFAYAWSGENSLIAAFAAVNESTWEHMKILFFPLFLVTLLEMTVFTERHRNFLAVKAVSVLAATALIPVAYYTYTGILGFGVMAADVAIFYLGAALSTLLTWRLLERGRLAGGWLQMGGLLLLWGLAFLFVWFTYRTPHIALFQDPLTGGFGLE